jgi:hypothetical protein
LPDVLAERPDAEPSPRLDDRGFLMIPADAIGPASEALAGLLREQLPQLLTHNGQPLPNVAAGMPGCGSDAVQAAHSYIREGKRAADKIDSVCEAVRPSKLPRPELPELPPDVLDLPAETRTALGNCWGMDTIAKLADYRREQKPLVELPEIGRGRAVEIESVLSKFCHHYSPSRGAGRGFEAGALYLELSEPCASAVAYTLPSVRGDLSDAGRPKSDLPTLHAGCWLRLPAGSRWQAVQTFERRLLDPPSPEDTPAHSVFFGKATDKAARIAIETLQSTARDAYNPASECA